MRLMPVLLIALVVAFAGCAKKNDTPTDTTTTTTPTTSTTTSSTPTSSSTTTTSTPSTTTTTPTTPTAPPPMDISTSADFASNTGPPPDAPVAKAITIPAGYTAGNLTVTWTCDSPAPACAASPANGDIAVKVAGLTCTLPAGPNQDPIPKCNKTGPVTAGDTKITYTGFGPVTAKIVFSLT